LVPGATYTFACGFEDPNSASVARGTLNFVYPKALYVTSAVWRAQLDGVIPRSEPSAESKSLVAGRSKYDTAVTQMGSLRDKLSLAIEDRPVAAFSIVLLGPVLWTRFVPEGSALTMTPHVFGSTNSDVVIVTDEPVIRALVDGQVTAQAARDLGLIRFYGEPDRVQEMITWFDRLPVPTNKTALESLQQISH
jgi:hypothetical protein